MELKEAQKIAAEVSLMLMTSGACKKVQVAGSIRRQKPFVNDIDIVVIPANQGILAATLRSLGPFKSGGEKKIRIEPSRYNIDFDIYIATPGTWATLLLIRTGSTKHNIRLCSLAKSGGMTLKADGSGLFEHAPNQTEYENAADTRIAGDTEAGIFYKLGLPYIEPEKRE